MTSGLKVFADWMNSRKGKIFTVSKLKATNEKWSGIGTGESFVGDAAVSEKEDGEVGCVYMNSPYMHTSQLLDAQQKNEVTWLVKTLNSIYKVKLKENNE